MRWRRRRWGAGGVGGLTDLVVAAEGFEKLRKSFHLPTGLGLAHFQKFVGALGSPLGTGAKSQGGEGLDFLLRGKVGGWVGGWVGG